MMCATKPQVATDASSKTLSILCLNKKLMAASMHATVGKAGASTGDFTYFFTTDFDAIMFTILQATEPGFVDEFNGQFNLSEQLLQTPTL